MVKVLNRSGIFALNWVIVLVQEGDNVRDVARNFSKISNLVRDSLASTQHLQWLRTWNPAEVTPITILSEQSCQSLTLLPCPTCSDKQQKMSQSFKTSLLRQREQNIKILKMQRKVWRTSMNVSKKGRNLQLTTLKLLKTAKMILILITFNERE
jgi:hypothetical protein